MMNVQQLIFTSIYSRDIFTSIYSRDISTSIYSRDTLSDPRIFW